MVYTPFFARKKFWKRGYRKVYGRRSAGRAIGVTARQIVKGGTMAAKLANDIRQIKDRLNVEKKHKESNFGETTPLDVAQIRGDSEGYNVQDVTEAISQGIAHDQRVGNSLKLTGMSFKYQALGQTLTHTSRKLKFTLVKVSSPDIDSVAVSELMEHIYDVNPLTGLRDYNAPLNYSTLKQNGIKIIRSHTCYLKDQVFSGSTSTATKPHKTSGFSVKLNDVCRYASASATKPEGHRYFLIIQCDVGNSWGTASNNGNVPIQTANTGVEVRMHAKTWWVDN